MRFVDPALCLRRIAFVACWLALGPPVALAEDTALDRVDAVPEVQPIAYSGAYSGAYSDDRGFDRRRGAASATGRGSGWVYGWHWRGDGSDWRQRRQADGSPAASSRFAAPYGSRWTDRNRQPAWRDPGRLPSYQRYPNARGTLYGERRLLAEDELIRRRPWRSAPLESMEAQRWRDRRVGATW